MTCKYQHINKADSFNDIGDDPMDKIEYCITGEFTNNDIIRQRERIKQRGRYIYHKEYTTEYREWLKIHKKLNLEDE